MLLGYFGKTLCEPDPELVKWAEEKRRIGFGYVFLISKPNKSNALILLNMPLKFNTETEKTGV